MGKLGPAHTDVGCDDAASSRTRRCLSLYVCRRLASSLVIPPKSNRINKTQFLMHLRHFAEPDYG